MLSSIEVSWSDSLFLVPFCAVIMLGTFVLWGVISMCGSAIDHEACKPSKEEIEEAKERIDEMISREESYKN